MHSPDELKELVEEALEELQLWPALGGQQESARYALEMGGKRIRPVISLAVGEALEAEPEQAMPAALAIELVHNFSLVHDDLPSLDDDSERRGKRFFEDVVDFSDLKHGACAACHSGPMLNETNDFAQIALGIPKGTRFQTIGVSELNAVHNPVHDYVFTSADGSQTHVVSPDPGRALITGIAPQDDPVFSNVNAFKTPSLWGVHKTAPYFHDNSAKSLEELAEHYAFVFENFIGITLTKQDEADIVAFLKLL